MRPKFSHDVINSFFLWFDNFLMRKSDAYKTYTSRLYNYSDYQLPGKVVYGSPYKQWVYDRSVTGATIPSGLTVNGNFVSTGTSGLFFDFENGRAVFNSGVGTGLNITGTYTVKEINSYLTNYSEEQLVIDSKYETNSRFTPTGTYVKPYAPVVPAAFCSLETVNNEAFALGGMDKTSSRIKAVVFCENVFQLDGVLSTFADSFNTAFPIISTTNHPIGEFGALKTGLYPTGYDYRNAPSAQGYTSPCYIYDVNTAKIKDDVIKELSPTLYIGFVEFNIGTNRYPRI